MVRGAFINQAAGGHWLAPEWTCVLAPAEDKRLAPGAVFLKISSDERIVSSLVWSIVFGANLAQMAMEVAQLSLGKSNDDVTDTCACGRRCSCSPEQSWQANNGQLRGEGPTANCVTLMEGLLNELQRSLGSPASNGRGVGSN